MLYLERRTNALRPRLSYGLGLLCPCPRTERYDLEEVVEYP